MTLIVESRESAGRIAALFGRHTHSTNPFEKADWVFMSTGMQLACDILKLCDISLENPLSAIGAIVYEGTRNPNL
jgi:hypothetical protein